MTITDTDRLTADQVAELVHCNISTARRLMGKEIPAAKVGRRWTASRRDVEAYIRSKTFGPKRPKVGYRRRTP